MTIPDAPKLGPRPGKRSQTNAVPPAPATLMRTLGTFSTADGMSQLLLRLSVSSTVYCLSEMSSPWGFRVGEGTSPAFHLLTSGTAWLDVNGDGDGARLQAHARFVLGPSQNELVSLYQSAHVFVAAERKAGWCNTALEALASVSRWRRGLKSFFLSFSLSLAIVAAAGPQWGYEPEPVTAVGRDVVVVVDLSRSGIYGYDISTAKPRF